VSVLLQTFRSDIGKVALRYKTENKKSQVRSFPGSVRIMRFSNSKT
jgi:hypothetical protein